MVSKKAISSAEKRYSLKLFNLIIMKHIVKCLDTTNKFTLISNDLMNFKFKCTAWLNILNCFYKEIMVGLWFLQDIVHMLKFIYTLERRTLLWAMFGCSTRTAFLYFENSLCIWSIFYSEGTIDRTTSNLISGVCIR